MKCLLRNVLGRFSRNTGWSPIAAALVVLLSSVASLAQTPSLVSDPEDGGEFGGALTLTFLQIMKDPIAIEFQGAGGVQFLSEWQTFGGMFPNMILECTPQGTIPGGSTVIWTVNPNGTGFETETGVVFPTMSGSFHVTGGGGAVTVTAIPGDGDSYNPAVDGPVIFEFSEEMDVEVDPNDAVSFTQGTWSCTWVGSTTVECTLQGAAEPGDYYYTLSGFSSAGGDLMEDYYGSLVIDGGSGGLTVTPTPALGATYNPSVAGPVRFTFSEEMDLTVEPQSAITFSQGTWECEWVSSTEVSCAPTTQLAAGMVIYTLNGFRSATEEELPEFSGSFTVLQGGGPGGTHAPACPAESPNLAFPKTISVCGTTLFAWEYAVAFPDDTGSGYQIDAWSDTASGSLSSSVRLDAAGKVLSAIMGEDEDTEFVYGMNSDRVLAVRYPGSGSTLHFGVYGADGDLEPVFEHSLNTPDPYPEVSFLSDGKVLVVQDLVSEFDVILFSANGNVSWAKRFSSPSFGVGGGGGIPGLGGSQYVSVSEMETGFMLQVGQQNTSLEGETLQTTSTNILVRLAANGSVQWSKKYTGLNTMPAPSLMSTPSGALFLEGFAADMAEEEDPTFRSVLVRLNTNGEASWGMSILNSSLTVSAELPGAKFLLGGSTLDADGDLNRSVFAIMNGSGTLENAVQLRALDYNYGYGFVDDNRIFFSMMAALDGVGSEDQSSALIGSSNLELQNWSWLQYSKLVDSAMLIPDTRNASLVFSAFHNATHALDLVKLNASLQADAPCALFTNATVQATSTNLSTAALDVIVTAANVQSVNITPELLAGSISLKNFTLAQTAVCGGGVTPTPVTLTLRPGTGTVVLEFDTHTEFEYSLQRATRLASPDWTQVDAFAGTGARVSRNVVSDGSESYFRVVTSAP